MWIDVDTAIVVPMNIHPLTDDTDFKTVETGLVYNSAGIVVYWNFITTAGAQTQVEIHPTTAGVHDVTHAGAGMYSIEIPASSGNHANNDTEGFGWITGYATGILPWSGPVLGFRASGKNNMEVDGGTVQSNQIAMFDGTGYAGGTTKLDVNAVALSGDTVAADNAESFFDGTGYAGTGNTIPSVTTVATTTNVTNQAAKYTHGAVWIDTVNGASGTTAYTNGIMTNPSNSIANAKSIADNLKLKRFWIQAGSSVTLGADYPGYILEGRGYSLALGSRNISSCQIERAEGVTGTGTCATGEAVFYDCHLGTMTIGEADFNRCHLNGVVTMAQASVPYLFHGCSGVGSLAQITFAAASQSAVVAKWSGSLTVNGMVAGNTLWLDGNGDVSFAASCTGGTAYIAGNIKIVSNAGAQTVVDTARFDEDQSVASVVGNVNAVVKSMDADTVTASALKTDAVTEIQNGLATATALSTVDTVVDAIKAKTDNLPTDPADESALEAAIAAATSPLATASALSTVDTVVDAIKAKTDNLPSDPADESALEAAITAAASSLATAANLATVDTVVDAIKAKTDNLPATPAATGDAMTLTAAYDHSKDDVLTPLAVVDGIVDTILTKVTAILKWFTNKMTVTSSALVLYDDDNTTPTYSQVLTDDDITATRQKAT